MDHGIHVGGVLAPRQHLNAPQRAAGLPPGNPSTSAFASTMNGAPPAVGVTVVFRSLIALAFRKVNPVGAVTRTFSNVTFSMGNSGRPTIMPAVLVLCAVTLRMTMLR